MVNTSFGDTYVRIQGQVDGPPLVLLPGDSETSLSWMPVIEAFAAKHRVYALDHIYDIGRSTYTRRPRRSSDFVRWLDEFLDEIELHDVQLVGHSYGGWIATLHALQCPARLNKLVLVSPLGVVSSPLGLLIRAIVYGTVPSRWYIRRYLYWYAQDCVGHDVTRSMIDEMIDEDILARRCFKRRKIVPPSVLSDNDWRRLTVPCLFLVGCNDVSYSAGRAVQRLAAVAPHIATAVAEGDHHLTIGQPNWVIQHILRFLADR